MRFPVLFLVMVSSMLANFNALAASAECNVAIGAVSIASMEKAKKVAEYEAEFDKNLLIEYSDAAAEAIEAQKAALEKAVKAKIQATDVMFEALIAARRTCK